MRFIATISSAAIMLTIAGAAPHSAVKRSGLQDLCPTGATYYGPEQCSSGFVGCLSPADNWACTRSQKFYTNSCDGFGTFHTCASNDWKGCSTESMCDKPKPKPVPSVPTSPLPQSEPSKCPSGSSYVEQGFCKTGFVGCIPSNVAYSDYCAGTNGQNYQGWCPFGSGIFLNCYNKAFYGCTTEAGKCDTKA